ncbi:MAG TPA: hypothetical protein VMV63_05665 [Acidithiobacillus sp.]|nr:hypothetical protein [Acidithiobacillus sp.]
MIPKNFISASTEIIKPPRTTWRGTPLHELWLRDPTGYNLEVYARLTPEELAEMPADQEAIYLVPGPDLENCVTPILAGATAARPQG